MRKTNLVLDLERLKKKSVSEQSLLASELFQEEPTWDEINTITKGAVIKIAYTTMFINDCIYKLMFDLNGIKKTPLYKHGVKKELNKLNAFFSNYYNQMKYIHKMNMYVAADIMSAFEESVASEFDNLLAVVKKLVYEMGVPADRRKFVAYTLLMNLLCDASSASRKRHDEEFGRYRSDASKTISYLDIDPVKKMTKDIYCDLLGNIESKSNSIGFNKVHPAMTAFFRKLWSPAAQESVFAIDERSWEGSYGI